MEIGETETTRAVAWLKVEHCSATTASNSRINVQSPCRVPSTPKDLELNRGNSLEMDVPMHNCGINDARACGAVVTDDAETFF